MQLSVRTDITNATKFFKDYPKHVEKAASRAINRAIDAGRTTAAREISAATKIKQKEVRLRLTVRGSTPLNLRAVLTALRYSPNLRAFNARQNKAGVAASAWESRKTYKHAFILPSGQVVTRTTKKRFPLKGLRGPSVPNTFKRDDVIQKIVTAARQRFRSEFQREVLRRVGGSFQ